MVCDCRLCDRVQAGRCGEQDPKAAPASQACGPQEWTEKGCCRGESLLLTIKALVEDLCTVAHV